MVYLLSYRDFYVICFMKLQYLKNKNYIILKFWVEYLYFYFLNI